MVAVIGNKYVISSILDFLNSPTELIWFARQRIGRLLYRGLVGNFSSKKFPVKNIELQELRLELIYFFLKKGRLDLFGKGWGSLRNLPPKWQSKLSSVFSFASSQACDDKINTIKKYKFALCVENAKFSGYITEKIIDCFVAGVIPVYMGSPDINFHISRNCFIDLRDFKNLQELLDYLDNLSEYDANLMIKAGQDFIKSLQGRSFSYEGFAEVMENIIREEVRKIA